MKRTLLFCLSAVALTLAGCHSSVVNNVVCPVETAVVNTVAVTIASDLQCSNQAAIVTSIQAVAAKANICTSTAAMQIGKPKAKVPLKSVGSDICQTVADGLVGTLVSGAIPTAWGCTATTATASLTTLVNGACAKAFP